MGGKPRGARELARRGVQATRMVGAWVGMQGCSMCWHRPVLAQSNQADYCHKRLATLRDHKRGRSTWLHANPGGDAIDIALALT